MNSRKKLVLVASLVTGALAYLLITGLVSYSMYDAKIARGVEFHTPGARNASANSS